MILCRLSERKLFRLLKIGFYIGGFLRSCMYRIAINENSFVRNGRTSKFAMPASDANLIFRFRNNQFSFIGDHMNGFCGATLSTGSACCFFCINNTILLYKDGLPYLCQFLGFDHQRKHSTCRADLDTSHTFVCTEPLSEVHMRLHNGD